MTTGSVGEVTVVSVAGSLDSVLADFRHQVLGALAADPRAVVCDLSATRGAAADGTWQMVSSWGAYPRDWPAVPVGVVVGDEPAREGLERHALGRHLRAGATLPAVLSTVEKYPRPGVTRTRLSAHPTASRAARAFVARSCLDWGMPGGPAGACLVAAELVSNALVRTRTRDGIEMSMARHDGMLRLCVRDDGSRVEQADAERMRGRYVLVEGLSRSWGTMATAGGGRAAWAVVAG